MSFTPEQLAQRRKGIGASEIGAIAGLNPYMSALDVYSEKVGLKESFEGNERTMWGTILEPVIADQFFEKFSGSIGVKQMVEMETLHHLEADFFYATPDRILHLEDGSVSGLEVKNVGPGGRRHWGEQGTDEIPEWYLAQVAWQMFIVSNAIGVNIDKWFVAALFTGNELRVYEINWSDDLTDKLYKIGLVFWLEHVEKGNPPVDNAPLRSLNSYMAARFEDHDELIVDASDQVESWVGEMQRLRELRETNNELIGTLEAAVKGFIGDNLGVRGSFGTITWKRTKDRVSVDNRGLVSKLLDAGKISSDDVSDHTIIKPGSRRFLAAFKTEGSNEQ